MDLYDEEIIYPNCTVQVWRNSVTGEESIGWWPNEELDETELNMKEGDTAGLGDV